MHTAHRGAWNLKPTSAPLGQITGRTCTPVEGRSRVGDRPETSAPAAPDSCSASAEIGARLLDPRDTKRARSQDRLLEVAPVVIQLTRGMLAPCLHHSKRSVK